MAVDVERWRCVHGRSQSASVKQLTLSARIIEYWMSLHAHNNIVMPASYQLTQERTSASESDEQCSSESWRLFLYR